MGKKITQYTNNVSSNPDTGSLFDLSEKTGTSTYESRKWTISAFKTWVTAYCSIAWANITGKPTTIAGYGITDAVDTTGGTANYIAKFTDANTIEESLIQDNGTTVGVNQAPSSTFMLAINSGTKNGILGNSLENGKMGIQGSSTGTGSLDNSGVYGFGEGSDSNNYGIQGSAHGLDTTAQNRGASGIAYGSGVNIGISGIAFASAQGRYSAELSDGTEGVGKFYKCVHANGYGNWATLAISDITNLQTSLDAKQPLDSRLQSVTSSATVTATSTNDLVKITAQAEALTLANPTGTFAEGQPLMIRIKDNGTARVISYGAKFRAIGVTLPTTTVINKTVYLGVIYNSTDDKFDVLGVNQEA